MFMQERLLRGTYDLSILSGLLQVVEKIVGRDVHVAIPR